MKIKNITDSIRHGVNLLKGEESVNKTYCSEKSHADEPTAELAFRTARVRVFEVDRWSTISQLTASFYLYDPAGNSKPGVRPTVGDFLKIVLPGPMPENWTRVIEVVDEEKIAGFTVQPCADPHEKGEQTDHFFTDESTSTFQITKEETTITAYQIGEKESINNQLPEAGDRAVINTVIAGAGWLFYQKIQWKSLTDYLVDA